MTAQIPETIIYNSIEMALCSEPLNDYFLLSGRQAPFGDMELTCCWRGYLGTWEILDDRLYLIRLRRPMAESADIVLSTLLPGCGEKAFAHWYSGTLRIPQGKRLEYVHMGYGSSYERDLLLTVKRGVILDKVVKVNGVADEDAPEGYGIAAATIVPSLRGKTEEPE